MASTKITGINNLHVELITDLGVKVVESGKTFVVLPGDRAEALRTLVEARAAYTGGEWATGTMGNLFGTLTRKLESGKGVKEIEDAPAEESNVVDGPWEYDAPEGTPAEADEAEETAVVDEAEDASDEEAPAEVVEQPKAEKAPKAKPEPKRAALPEGYVTPVGLTAIINERGLYSGKRADGKLTSQSMYVYIKNNVEGSAHPFPLEIVNGRPCVKAEAGVEWWLTHQARVAEKAQLAAQRKQEKAEKAAARERAQAEKTEKAASGE